MIEITVKLAKNSMRAVASPNKSKLKPNNPSSTSIMPKNSTGERFPVALAGSSGYCLNTQTDGLTECCLSVYFMLRKKDLLR